jgi:hypothetical protein
MTSHHRYLTPLTLALTLALSGVARAESLDAKSPDNEERALELFQEGQAKMAKGDYTAACSKFEQSLEAKRGIGTMFNLAECRSKEGKTASAHAMFLEVAEATRELEQPERTKVAEQRAKELLPLLFRLTIEVQNPVTGLRVTLDGNELSDDELVLAQPVDPGTHHVEATAPGKRSWKLSVGVPSGPGTTTLLIPALDDAPAPGPVAVPPVATRDESTAAFVQPAAQPTDTGEPNTGRRVLTYGMAGLGVVGVAGAVAMGFEFKSNNDEARTICPTSRECTNEGILRHNELVDSAERARNWAFISGGAGGALLIGAAILWATEEDSPDTAVHATPFVSAGGVYGASVAGSF